MIRFSSNLLRSTRSYEVLNRFVSNKSFLTSDIQVSFTDDGQTIACFHPEPTFPYEHTRPLPRVEAKIKEVGSVLKPCLNDHSEIMYDTDYSMNELIRLTHVSSYQWRYLPNLSRRDKQKEQARKTIWDKKDREGI